MRLCIKNSGGEIIWLISIFLFTWIINMTIIRKYGNEGTIDLQLHDTFFIIHRMSLLFDQFIVTAFFVYLLKSSFQKFKRLNSNLILSIFSVAMIFMADKWEMTLSGIPKNGCVIYPPLNWLENHAQTDFISTQNNFAIGFILIKILLMVGLFLLGFKTGILKK